MACSVFGTPITEETLKGMTKYHDKEIRRVDKASVAFEMKNAEGKDVNAHNYLDDLRKAHDTDGIKVVIYNATGGPVKLAWYCHGDGCIGPSPIPMVIANGQWGAYFHPVDPKDSGLGTAGHVIIFEGKNADGDGQHWLYLMEASYPGKCYTKTSRGGEFSYDYNVYKAFLRTVLYDHDSHQGCTSFASIGCDTRSPFFEGIMTLNDAFGW